METEGEASPRLSPLQVIFLAGATQAMKPNRFGCQHCHESFTSPYDTFVHIWTAHLHKDLALEPAESKSLLHKARVYGWWDIRPLATFS